MWIELAQTVQAAAQEAITTAPAHGDIAEKTITQIPLAIAIVKGIEWVKKLNLPGLKWLSEDSSRGLLQAVNVGAAFLATAGITGTFAYADTGTVTIVVTGLSDVGSKLFSFVAQLGFQQHFYDVTQLRKVAVTTHNVVMGTGPGDVAAVSTNPKGTGDGTV